MACNNQGASVSSEGISEEESVSCKDYGDDTAGDTIQEEERIRRASDQKNETENTTGEEDADMR